MDSLTPLQQGIEQFNRRDFYACHDTLEALWMEAEVADRAFYQGILQIAVGCYHLENLNWHGAVLLLGEGTRRISSYEADWQQIDVARLLEASLSLLESLQQTESDRIAEVLARLEGAENSAERWPYIYPLEKD